MRALHQTQISDIELDKVAAHPRNLDFFPDASQEEIEQLSEDIKADGLLHPVEVVEVGQRGSGDYVLVMGHRRTAAVRLLGWTTIPAIIRQDTHDPMAPQVISALIRDNTVRSQPDELALLRCYKELKKTYYGKAPSGTTLRDYISMMLVGKKKGRTFERRVKLLELPRDFQDLISKGPLTRSKGLEILSMSKSARRKLYADYRTHGNLFKALGKAGLLSKPKQSSVDDAVKLIQRTCRDVGQLRGRLFKAEALTELPEYHRDLVAHLSEFFEEWETKLNDSEAA